MHLYANCLRKIRGRLYVASCRTAHTWCLDHVVYGVSDLQLGIDAFKRVTGVKPVIGGQHVGLGTHNAIFSLGNETYFEIIAPDPEQSHMVSEPQWMGMAGVPTDLLQVGFC